MEKGLREEKGIHGQAVLFLGFCFVCPVAQVEFGLVLMVGRKRGGVEMCTGW